MENLFFFKIFEMKKLGIKSYAKNSINVRKTIPFSGLIT